MNGKPVVMVLAVLPLLVSVGLLAACGTQPSGSGPPPTPHPASADEMDLVRHALITDVASIQTAHRIVTFTTIPPEQKTGSTEEQGGVQPTWFEGDFKAPDTLYARGNLNGVEFERLLTAQGLHRKNETGDWVQYSESDNAYLALFYGLNMPYDELRPLLLPAEAGSIDIPTLIDTGSEEQFDGTVARRFSWDVSVEPSPAQKERVIIEVWVDPAAKRVHKLLECRYRVGTANKAMGDWCWSVVSSKFNEPVTTEP